MSLKTNKLLQQKNFKVAEKEGKGLLQKRLQLKRKKLYGENKQRKIMNPDSQTCWLNSCLQLVLTAMDHFGNIAEFGSDLWNQLIWLQGKDPSVVLDPTDIKKCHNHHRKTKINQRKPSTLKYVI